MISYICSINCTGVHFKKWLIMQSKIKAGAMIEVSALFFYGLNVVIIKLILLKNIQLY